MNLFGVHLTVLAGPGIPLPLPQSALAALNTLEIAVSTAETSALQAQFKAGRSAALADVDDYPIMKQPGLKAGARITIMLTLGVVPAVLFDGVVTQTQLNPGQGQGDGTLAITAMDVRALMDREEPSETRTYPAMPVAAIAAMVMARYAQYGLIPLVVPPAVIDVDLPIDRVTTQSGTDLQFLKQLAERSGCIFTVSPGPVPLTSTGYFGPRPTIGLPQGALTVNMGPDSNVLAVNFQNNATDAHSVVGNVQDRSTNQAVQVHTTPPLRPPLATEPALSNPTTAGQRRYEAQGGRSSAGAIAEAQAQADRSGNVVTAEGELDGTRYGRVLQPRQLVGLRGAGREHDGFYFVEEVKHQLKRGEYKQHFKLSREGLGSTTPVVAP
jgi:phage protein D